MAKRNKSIWLPPNVARALTGEVSVTYTNDAILKEMRAARARAQQAEAEAAQLRDQLDQPPAGAPARGSDVDAWLDYRAKEKRRGTWYTLEQIAKWSGFSLSKLKRKSSERKPRGAQKRPSKSNKKFGS